MYTECKLAYPESARSWYSTESISHSSSENKTPLKGAIVSDAGRTFGQKNQTHKGQTTYHKAIYDIDKTNFSVVFSNKSPVK